MVGILQTTSKLNIFKLLKLIEVELIKNKILITISYAPVTQNQSMVKLNYLSRV